MRTTHLLLLALPWIGTIPQATGPKGDVHPPVVDPASPPSRASGDPVRDRVLVPPPTTEGPVIVEEPRVPSRSERPPVDRAWLERLDARLETDLRLLVGVLGGDSRGPDLARFLARQAGRPVADRIVAKEELLRELLEIAADP